jgi:hypothetical protein
MFNWNKRYIYDYKLSPSISNFIFDIININFIMNGEGINIKNICIGYAT